jgi:hypothetical protein
MLGAFARAPVRRVLAVVVFDAASFGGVTVAASAAAAAADHTAIAGVLLAALAIGAGVAGLVYGSRPRTGRRRLQLTLLFAAAAAMMAAAGAEPVLVVTAVLMLGLGIVGGPRDTLLQLVLGDATAEHQRTESFAWMGTSMWLGFGLGAGMAGQVAGAETISAGPAFLVAAVGAAMASLLCLRLRLAPAAGPVAPPAQAAVESV